MCGAPLIGESGRGKGGTMYYYYTCAARKKSHTCKKINEKKGFLEWYAVEQTVEHVLQPARMEYIAKRIVEAYDKEFSTSKVAVMEKQLAQLNRDIARCADDYMETRSKSIKQQLETKADQLDAQREDLEVALARLRVAAGIRYTKLQILDWLRKFCHGDPCDPAFQQHIINVFINSVYVYDDKIVIYYNIKGGEQICYMEMLESTEEPADPEDQRALPCSDMNGMVHHQGLEPWTP